MSREDAPPATSGHPDWKCPKCGHSCPADDVEYRGLPISEMIRRGWLFGEGGQPIDARDTPAVKKALARFFGVDDFAAVERRLSGEDMPPWLERAIVCVLPPDGDET